MRFTADQFLTWPQKRVTLLGMSGVGKTRLAGLLAPAGWFHYSGDYRIGTRYLDEAIIDHLKAVAAQVPELRALLHSGAVAIRGNVTPHNLEPVSAFLGMVGDPEQGGLPLHEFKRRQALHRMAEIHTMWDVPDFIGKAERLYGARHFINDAGGSLCELDEPGLLDILAEHSLILYIEASDSDRHALLQRAVTAPKPLYYREAFLDEHLALYLRERGLPYVALIDPQDFARWVFPLLLEARIPRYRAIAADYGYTIYSEELAEVSTEADFVSLVAHAIRRHADPARPRWRRADS